MAYTLNTSHALYGNLIELIGVQSGALVSHKTARTFTKHAEASYGTGTYGEHLSTVNGGYTPKGASFSPALVRDTYTNPNYTIVEVFNSVGAGNASVAFLNNNGGTYTFSSPSWSNTRLVGVSTCYINSVQSATALETGAVMLSTTRADGAGNVKLYVNVDQVATANPESFNANTGINYLGGYDGQGAYAADLVWVAIFDKVLSAAEIADLYASLGASNAFGLVGSSSVTHNATGALASNAATLSGTASRTGASVTHSATAALSASTATLSGTSSRAGSTVTHAATATLATGSATLSGTVSHAASGSFVSDIMVNNTGTAQTNVSIVWEWNKGVIGSAKTSTIYGTGTTSGTGTYTATGLPSGNGFLLATTADGSVYYQTGTVV